MAKRLMAMLFFFLAIFLAMVCSSLNENTEPAVPAIYIFGDSTFDVGTNSFLNSSSRADKQFYGIDSPLSKPTGRFSNGYNAADRIVNLLGYTESPPPFLYLVQNDSEHFNREILKGVNFASGGSGLLDQTGRQFNRVISMAEQIQQFETVHGNISQYLNDTAETRINKSIFLISTGSNDIFEFFNNLSHSHNTTSKVQEFLTTLTNRYQAHLQNLLNLGARKFGILSVPPLGCVPILRAITSDGKCVAGLNAFARLFYTAMFGVLGNLNTEFPDMKYSLGNTYEITCSMINNPSPFHLKDVKSACCGNQTLTDGVPCSPKAQVCENRDQFLFWDQYHPTEYTCQLAALSLYSGGSEYASPTNFSLLVQPS